MTKIGEPLSDRELDVLQCAAAGASNREIADQLVISPNTVKVHLRNIYAKLGAASRMEAVTVALQQGILTVDDSAARPIVLANDSDDDDFDATDTGDEDDDDAPVASVVSMPAAPPAAGGRRAPATVTFPRHWVIIGTVGLFVLISVISLFALRQSQLAARQLAAAPSPTPAPFVATPIGDSRWLIHQPAPLARAGAAVAGIGLNLYQIGGSVGDSITGDGVASSGYVLNTKTAVWEAIADKPTAVSDAAAAVVTDQIFVIGGRDAAGAPTATVEAYSPSTNSWRPVAALPQPAAGGLALAANSQLYYFGGTTADGVTARSLVYDPTTDSWRPLPPLAQARAYAAGGVVNGVVYVVGGSDGQSDLAVCEQFDVATESWAACPPLLEGRAGAAGAVLLDKLYVLGGGLHGPVTHGEVLDTKTGTWSVINMPMLETARSWAGLGVVPVETRLYVVGGRLGDRVQDGTYVYAPSIYYQFLPVQGAGP